jgi:hypothetical protein
LEKEWEIKKLLDELLIYEEELWVKSNQTPFRLQKVKYANRCFLVKLEKPILDGNWAQK